MLRCGEDEMVRHDPVLHIDLLIDVQTDMMMFLNVAVAVTCCAFCWVIAIVGFKGWLKSRTNLQLSFNNTP